MEELARGRPAAGPSAARTRLKKKPGTAPQRVTLARIEPPIVILKNDDTRLHAFGTSEHLIAHMSADHAFDWADWRIFDLTGAELDAVVSGSGLSGLAATSSMEEPKQLARRIKNVLKVVEDRVEEEPPPPDAGIDPSSWDGLKSLPYEGLLDRLVELFWEAEDQGAELVPSKQPGFKKQSGAQSPAAGSVAGTGLSGGSRPRPGNHTSTDAVTTVDGEPHPRGWVHNVWGH